MYCIAADSDAVAATTIVCAIAPCLLELAHHVRDRWRPSGPIAT